jgi:D-alanine-D-alanine ligase
MRIGISYNLKSNNLNASELPDDFQEEFDNPETVESIAEVLRGLDHEVEKLGDGKELLESLLADPPDFVFNFAEGQGIGRCREARVPAVLEMLGIPYTGSDPLTMAATLDKDVAKRLVMTEGVWIPQGGVFGSGDDVTDLRMTPNIGWPVIVKPSWEGSSKGVRGKCVVDNENDLRFAIENLRQTYRQPVLVEEFIAGDELTVGVVGNATPRVIGVMRVLPKQTEEQFVYSLEVKRDWRNRVGYESPARLPADQYRAVEHAALKAYRVLGCRDVSRLDFRLRDGIPYFLEVNPLPGLNPETSDLVILSRGMGWTYERLIETILQEALERHGLAATTLTTARH